MEAILDSNFIISCIKKKIDFLSQLEAMGFRICLPKEVFQELKDIRLNVPHSDKEAIEIALQMFSNKKIKKMSLGKGSVDSGLIAAGKKGAYIATLDSLIKHIVPNKILIKDSTKGLEVERA